MLGGFRVSERQRERDRRQRRARDGSFRPGAHVLRVGDGLPAPAACARSTSRTPTMWAIPSRSRALGARARRRALRPAAAATRALIDELEAVAQRSDRLFVVTLGPAGSLALGRGARIACPAHAVAQVVDTTGAGDAFTAGFLCEYAHSRRHGASLARGHRGGRARRCVTSARSSSDMQATIPRWRSTRPAPPLRQAAARGRHRARAPGRSTGSASRATSGSSASPRRGATRRSSRP